MERITPSEMKRQNLVKIGDWGFGTASSSGEIVCRREDREAVQAAYDAIPESDMSSGVLDNVIAAGGKHVVIEW
jgi:hypothetical protein